MLVQSVASVQLFIVSFGKNNHVFARVCSVKFEEFKGGAGSKKYKVSGFLVDDEGCMLHESIGNEDEIVGV